MGEVDDMLKEIDEHHPADRKKIGLFVSAKALEEFQKLIGKKSVSIMFERWIIKVVKEAKKRGKK